MNRLFRWFETRIDPYPDEAALVPDKGLWPFVRSSLQGVRRWLVLLIIMVALIGVLEALLFQWMGFVVDWIGKYPPETLWQEKGSALGLMAAVMIASPLLVLLASNLRFQTLQGVMPMRLRWRFHRLMLGQSLSFYQDEFAGRVSAKVMQTALAIRDAVMTCADMLVYIIVYFLTSSVVLWQFDAWLLVPFVAWMLAFVLILWRAIPQLARLAERQADARALMTGRITDAYSNITTVKLFSHSQRESDYARSAMEEFLQTVHAQMRRVSMLEVLNHSINIMLIGSTAGLGLWLWHGGHVS